MGLIDVNPTNVESHGFFCYMSKKKSLGYQRKLKWLEKRFAEGMRIKLLELPDRGFVEYIPGEFAWRAVDAKGYMFIHCLWVVGKSKGQGYATEAARALVSFGFGTLRLHRVFATCDVRNVASARVLEKVGMRREGHCRGDKWVRGQWRDSYIYAMLEDEWSKSGSVSSEGSS